MPWLCHVIIDGLKFLCHLCSERDARPSAPARARFAMPQSHSVFFSPGVVFPMRDSVLSCLVLATTPCKCLAYSSPSHPRTARRPRSMAVLQNNAEAGRAIIERARLLLFSFAAPARSQVLRRIVNAGRGLMLRWDGAPPPSSPPLPPLCSLPQAGRWAPGLRPPRRGLLAVRRYHPSRR